MPWLSLRPHQTVQLKLEVEFLNQNPVQPTNLFTVAAHPDYVVTIASKTNAAPMQLVPVHKQVFDVTIECLRPSATARLRVEDEHGNLVGQLNIVENLFVYELPLRVVYVLLGKPMNKHDAVGATPPRPLYARPGALAALQQVFERLNFIDYLNNHTLNQALITCVLNAPPTVTGPMPTLPYHILIDEDQWKADGILKGRVLQPDSLPEYCEHLADKAYGVFGGTTIFVHELDRMPTSGPIAASGTIEPVAAKTLLVFRAGLNGGKKSTIAHELGHVLGLMHSFIDGDEDSTLTQLANSLPLYQSIITQGQATLASQQHSASTPPTLTQQATINQTAKSLKINSQRLDRFNAMQANYVVNPYKFNQFSTENMMDYDPSASANQRFSYWRWQWLVMQADVSAYYGTKKAAV